MSGIPMEDNFEDILGKALRGTGLADEILEFLTGVPEETIVKLKDGEFEEAALRKVQKQQKAVQEAKGVVSGARVSSAAVL